MQTFLPHPNFACSAMVLDRQRLGKQIIEARQVLSALRSGGGWRNHPVTKMWRDCDAALMLYHDVMLREWLRRGYVHSYHEMLPPPSSVRMPEWLGRGDFHASHRAALLLKDPAHYGQFGWTERPVLAIVYPTVAENSA